MDAVLGKGFKAGLGHCDGIGSVFQVGNGKKTRPVGLRCVRNVGGGVGDRDVRIDDCGSARILGGPGNGSRSNLRIADGSK